MDNKVSSDNDPGEKTMLDSFVVAVLSKSGIKPEEWTTANADIKEKVYLGVRALIEIDGKGKSIELSDVATLQPIEAFASAVKQTQESLNAQYHARDWKIEAAQHLVTAATTKDPQLQAGAKEGAYRTAQGYIKKIEHTGQDYDEIMQKAQPSTDVPSKYLAGRHDQLHGLYGSLGTLDSVLRTIPAPKAAAKK